MSVVRKKYAFEVDGVIYQTDDDELDARAVRSLSGHDPAAEWRLIQIMDRFTRSLGLEDSIALAKGEVLSFRAMRSDRDYSFTVEDRGWEWGASTISEIDVRRYAHIADDRELVVSVVGGDDFAVPRGDQIDLTGQEIERIYSRETRAKPVTIIVEGTPHPWSKQAISYAEVVTLEVPNYAQHPEITYSVRYKNGLGSKPSGTLAPGASVKVKDGMVFNVSETGQS
jgi:hypothetical protein